MPEQMDIDTAALRQMAAQHERVARDTREWAEPPQAWLANFEPTYGRIADPVKRALHDYYNARQRAGEQLAKEHENTRDSLLAAADAYDKADEDQASNIRNAGERTNSASESPPSPPPASPGTGGAVPSGPAGGPPGGPPDGQTASGSAAASTPPAATAPEQNVGAGATQPMTGAPAGENQPTDGGTTPNAGAGAGAGADSGAPAGAGAAGMGTGAAAAAADRAGDEERGSGYAPVGGPMMTPFHAAVAAAKDKAAGPAYEMGNTASDDLVLARTLLGAVLAAVEPTIGMTWAVSVMRGPAGTSVYITSNEGRGWLPAGLYVPNEVATPWSRDELLGTESGESGSAWEGVSDPARILVEFGLTAGAQSGMALSALVSSGSIDAGLRAGLTNVQMADLVGPAYDVDLRVATPDAVDRLDLAGTTAARGRAASVPDSQIRPRCIELAVDAQNQLARSASAVPEAAASRAVRDRIIASVQAGTPVPRHWWDELQEADDLLAGAMISRRVDVGRVELGELRIDAEAAGVRSMAWERRCNELVALLAEESDEQNLRDAVFAHDQIVNHPAFVFVPPAVSAVEPERIERTVGTSGSVVPPVAEPEGAVSAPELSGPPSTGAVAPPVTPWPGKAAEDR